MSPGSAAKTPKKIGRYRVEAELGRGMMGIVYRAVEPRTKRRVALKVIRATFVVSEEQRRNFERRFLEEARIVSSLSHPGIVKLIEFDEDPALDAAFIALEYLEGRTLSQILVNGPPLAWRESLRIVARVAEALHYAHGQGVIHRDIKPGNIMLLASGEPKLMDFGVAKLTETGLELTSTGQFMGTPLYMSPEQALGEPVDSRADLFSLGSIAYTLLTGKRAFEADSVPQVLNRVAYQHPAAPTSVAPGLPPDVDYLLTRAMAKPKEARYPDGRTLAEDIEDVLAGRPPRHHAGWRKPDVGEGTVASQRPAGAPARAPVVAELSPSELQPVPEAASRRATATADIPLVRLPPAPRQRPRRGHAPVALLTLSMLVLGIALYSSAFWRARIEELVADQTSAVPASATPSAPPALPSEAAAVVPSPTPGVGLSEPATGPPADATPEPPADTAATAPPLDAPSSTLASPVPTPAPEADDPAPDADVDVPTPAPGPAPTRPTPAEPPTRPLTAVPATSRLSIALEHHLQQGSARVWIDGKLVFERALSSRVTRDLLLFKLRSGGFEKVLPVKAGKRSVRVQIRSGSRTGAGEVTGTLKAGVTHTLHVTVEDGGERVKLEWE